MASSTSEPDAVPNAGAPEPERLTGIGGSGGIGIGRLVRVDSGRRSNRARAITRDAVAHEFERFNQAVTKAKADMVALLDRARLRAPGPERSILEAYSLMLGDNLLRQRVEAAISQELRSAEWCLDREITAMAAELRATSDDYLRERSGDIESVGQLLQAALADVRQDSSVPPASSESSEPQLPTIVVARQLSPAQISALDPADVAGIVTETGTVTSHTAIIARALGIPAVVGCRGAGVAVVRHTQGIVDGTRGEFVLSPTREQIEVAQRRRAQRRQRRHGADLPRGAVRTRCGTVIEVLANTEFPKEVNLAMQQGAGGIGLYRTEFLCADYGRIPNEDEQLWIYRDVLERAGDAPVTFRTFDLGGDKDFGSATRAGTNAALGLRGIRWSLQHPETLAVQLRAICRASIGRSVRVMLPMVTCVSELREVRRLLAQAQQEVSAAGVAAPALQLGCMIEVPAAALRAELLAKASDFLSIGTNDLTQYVCAADRGNPLLATIGDYLQPAVLELIKRTGEAGRAQGCPVSVCGAMASDPAGVIALLGLGVRSLSLESSSLQDVTNSITNTRLEDAEQCARQALEFESPGQVRDLLQERFRDTLEQLDSG
jgi:phosphotransferase system enzyme I (PtsI)